ncbi:MAG: hypothetical protein HYR84_15375 [Planctomycetes bacterium]|nr:hypothetical protein [Planctomycetota bacterium]
MNRCTQFALVVVAFALVAQQAVSQESKAAQTTRAKLKQIIDEFEAKDLGTKALFEEINDKVEKPLRFKIDNTSGISNNTKLSFKKTKKITVEKLLNDLSDQNGFGWFVNSNEGNNKIDGWITIRKNEKGKERGYEAGKEPKKTSAASPRETWLALREARISASREPREAAAVLLRAMTEPGGK